MEQYLKYWPSKEIKNETKDMQVYYMFNNSELLVKKNGNGYYVPTKKELEDIGIEVEESYCLGQYNEKDMFTGDLKTTYNNGSWEMVKLRKYLDSVGQEEFLSASRALLLLDHARSNKKCGVCGSDMEYKIQGNDRCFTCISCNHMVWPKTALAIIVAVVKDDKLLLAHNKAFEEGKYSHVAGFVEMGELLEDCVKREVLEETGIKVHNINYFGSQPWAFPNSYMLGFTAEYLDGEIMVDDDEISDARWFSKEEIPEANLKTISISSRLTEWFVNNR